MALSAGFVGCGNITDTHARAAREAGLGIAAFFGRDPAKAEAMAARFGGRAFARYEDFLAYRPMDLVVIGSHGPRSRSVTARDDVTIQILDSANRPVLVVPEDSG